MTKPILILFLLLITACTKNTMKLEILEERSSNVLPSGSGIIKYKGNYLAIGDDAPFLFMLDEDFTIIKRIPLLENIPTDTRFSKAEKPDFETLELIADDEVVVFGSGSKSPQRDLFLRIVLGDSVRIERYELTAFYQELKRMPMMHDAELNIEATAYHNKQLFLFNRDKNIIFQFGYDAFLQYVQGDAGFPTPLSYSFQLPSIKGLEAGFSGATFLKGASKIVFTAAVEDTDNAYDDGEILGSFIGLIDFSNHEISPSYDFCRVPQNKSQLKIESVTIDEEHSGGTTSLILIADDDRGSSTFLKGNLTW
ncbi:hypothetical protein QWY31_09530 [Cytophagales bacterium LB-30]|uniref:Uncharacterized protein n=1 Tax=Shiella aurantiaca TaxID=3058365 RepID=A0ABT8F5S6_9BACT|nr:hypothetical protein [Shiella aurantiaca]MDN4165743.1 hypothetical protein [Shiella aurantiaca]